jgi:hypothetical protein
MKQETVETIQANSKREKKSNLEVFSIGHFYNLQTQKQKKEVSLKLYKKIIITFFQIYFNELYFKESGIYFPFGGYLKKVLYASWHDKIKKKQPANKKKVHGSDGSIGFMWYLRPSMKMQYLVSINKLTGSTNRIPQIESNYLKNNNKDLLPIFTEEFSRMRDDQILYVNR